MQSLYDNLKGVANTERLSRSGRTARFTGSSRRVEFESVVKLDMGGRLPGVYLVTTQVAAQPLSPGAAEAVVQAELDDQPSLLVVRTHFGVGVEKDAPYVDPGSSHLQHMGALTLAEEFTA